MKKLLAVSAIAVLGLNSVVLAGGLPEEMPMAPSAVSTSEIGVYFGIQGGWGLTHWKDTELSRVEVNTVSNDNGFVGRAFLGFDINRYFALEGGYTYFFNKPKFKTAAGVETGKVKRTHNVDVMGKIKAPVVDNFDLYAKLGVNYLMAGFDEVTGYPKPDSRNNFNVAYGAGADYYITPNIIANAEWLRFNGKAKTSDSKYQPATDAFLIGLRYKFDL
ncbi:MAG: outer membrane beta-barrel protein [Coxiellaceae bacterium]|jgi:OOP family OmpA-OmpF porin|nr:outer membrane beta-barrel protein [Coxiellaceae bacterium]